MYNLGMFDFKINNMKYFLILMIVISSCTKPRNHYTCYTENYKKGYLVSKDTIVVYMTEKDKKEFEGTFRGLDNWLTIRFCK